MEIDRKNVKIAVVFNEPVVTENITAMSFTPYSKEYGSLVSNSYVSSGGYIDLSEVGVLEARLQIEEALRAKGYRTKTFNINSNVKRLIEFLEEEKPTIIFNLCESLLGQSIHEMHVAGIFELLNIPYTGSTPITLGTCLNKVQTKEILAYHAIPTARHQVFNSEKEINKDNLRLLLPIIVKPLKEDASAGIENDSVVNNINSLIQKVKKVTEELKQPALVEEYIDGREINVAILGNDPPVVLPLSEIDFSGLPEGYPPIVTYNAKWLEGSPEYKGTIGKCPAELPDEIEKEIKQIALDAYKIMEVRDYARVDIRLDKNLKPYVLEVNPNPDISIDAGYIRSAKEIGMTYEDVMDAIVQNALKRTNK